MRNKKVVLLAIAFLVLLMLGYALSGFVTIFTNGSLFNITFLGRDNHTYFIDIPLYAYVVEGYINLSTFSGVGSPKSVDFTVGNTTTIIKFAPASLKYYWAFERPPYLSDSMGLLDLNEVDIIGFSEPTTPAPGIIGEGRNFSYYSRLNITYPDTINVSDYYTINFFLNLTNLGVQSYIFDTRTGGGQVYFRYSNTGQGHIGDGTHSAYYENYFVANTSFNMYTITTNASGTHAFRNGAHFETDAPVVTGFNSSIFEIGYLIDGTLDEFSIFNESLNSTKINSMYNNYLLGETPLIAINNSQKINISNDINSILGGGCNCLNCTIYGTDCRVPFTFYSVTTGILEMTALDLSYEYGITPCNSTYNQIILNLTYFQESAGTSLTLDNAYDLTFSGLFEQSLTGSFTGNVTDSFCTIMDGDDIDLDWDITGTFQLEKELYGTKVYEYPIGAPLTASNKPFKNKSLYLTLLNESTTVTFTWFTNNYESIDGTMIIYRCVGDGTRTEVDSVAIINGEAAANLELITTPYSYEVVYQGTLYTDDSSYTKCHVETQDARTYFVTVGTDVTPAIGLYSIVCNMTKSNNVTALMEWGTNPESTDTLTGCLFSNRITPAGSVLVDTVCSNSSGIERVIPANAYTYYVSGKMYQGGYTKPCDVSLTFNPQKTTSRSLGLMGIISIIFLVGGLILLLSNEEPKWYPIGGILGIILAFILGITPFGWVTISSMMFFVFIIILIGRHSRAPT